MESGYLTRMMESDVRRSEVASSCFTERCHYDNAMPERCPHCGFPLPFTSVATCPDCGQALFSPKEAAAISEEPMSVPAQREAMPLDEPAAPSISKAAAQMPECPAALLIVFSGVLSGMQGLTATGDNLLQLNFRAPSAIIGCAIGVVIGVILAWDHRIFQQKLKSLEELPTDDLEPAPMPNIVQRPSEWIAITMLVVPFVTGVIAWLDEPLHVTHLHLGWLGAASIVATAILGYFSARQMALRIELRPSNPGAFRSPAFTYLAILFFWLICYPAHFLIRWRMGGRNLFPLSLVVVAVYLAPLLYPFVTEPGLPTIGDHEVLGVVRNIMDNEPMMAPVTIADPVEVSFDDALQQRIGRCTVKSQHGDEPVTFKLSWQDRSRGVWQVQVLDLLPHVNAPETLGLLQQILNQNRNDLVTVRDPVQIRYEPAKQRRIARATTVSAAGEQRIFFVIEWEQPGRTRFRIQTHLKEP